jgi:tRNA(Met) C34 N-acetyltransferase TmcA
MHQWFFILRPKADDVKIAAQRGRGKRASTALLAAATQQLPSIGLIAP